MKVVSLCLFNGERLARDGSAVFVLFAAIYGRDGDNGEGEASAYGERWYRMRVNGGRVNDGFLDS